MTMSTRFSTARHRIGWLPLPEKEGFVLLSNWECGFRNITNNKRPILKPEDAKGLKIRATAGNAPPGHHGSLGAVVTRLRFPKSIWPFHKMWWTARRILWPSSITSNSTKFRSIWPHTAYLQQHDARGQPAELGQVETGATKESFGKKAS